MSNEVRSYKIESIYLEIARSITRSTLYKLYKKPGEPDDLDKEANIKFGAIAISICFSYATIESFCNIQLYSKYSALTPALKKAGWELGHKNSKYKHYFDDKNSFNGLLFKELKEKLKVLASVCDIEPIHKKDRQLWNDISQICKDMRDFVIHPTPHKEDFQDYMNKIMAEYKPKTYYDVVERALTYFYEETGEEVPVWVRKNVIFRFLNTEDLLKKRKD